MFFHKSYFWEFFINNAFSLCVLNILVITGIHTHAQNSKIFEIIVSKILNVTYKINSYAMKTTANTVEAKKPAWRALECLISPAVLQPNCKRIS